MTDSDIFLSDFPDLLATALNVSDFVAGILMSCVFLVMVLLPIIIAKKGKSNFITEMIVGIVAITFLMAVGWLPLYVGLVINVLVAIALSAKLRDWLG